MVSGPLTSHHSLISTRATVMFCWRATPEKEGSFKYFGLVLANILVWFSQISGLVLAITNMIPPSDPSLTPRLRCVWDRDIEKPRSATVKDQPVSPPYFYQFLSVGDFFSIPLSRIFFWDSESSEGFSQCFILALEYYVCKDILWDCYIAHCYKLLDGVPGWEHLCKSSDIGKNHLTKIVTLPIDTSCCCPWLWYLIALSCKSLEFPYGGISAVLLDCYIAHCNDELLVVDGVPY